MKSRHNILFQQLRKDVHRALRQWHTGNDAQSSLEHLYAFRRLHRQEPGSQRRVTNQLLLNAMQALRKLHEADVDLLQARFLEQLPIHMVANRLHVAESTVYVLQRQAITRLTEVIMAVEQAALSSRELTLLQRLEPRHYVALLGVDEQVKHLEALLTTNNAPWLIAVEGIGGIGKTSLVDQLMRQLVAAGHFDEIAWVSIRQQRFSFSGAIEQVAEPVLTADQLLAKLTAQLLPQFSAGASAQTMLSTLRTQLQATPHVIVLDNLETLADVEALLPTLRLLTNPSKFILTSRRSLFSEPDLYHIQVQELGEPNALQLIRQEARLSNLPELAVCSDADLRPIFATVGGNPLALRLVVGQAHLYTLPSILYELRRARGRPVEALYEFIYRTAWDHLDPLSRQALLIMPLGNPRGDDIEYLAEVGDLAVDELRMALSKLVILNLVDARGGLYDRRYSIHGLTRTFLQEQVARWF